MPENWFAVAPQQRNCAVEPPLAVKNNPITQDVCDLDDEVEPLKSHNEALLCVNDELWNENEQLK